jgi:hypothetical protein
LGVAHRFAVNTRRRTEVVTAAADAARKKLLVDHPIGQALFSPRDDLRPMGAKGRSKIFIAKSYGVFFDVTVGIDDAHVTHLQNRLS